MGFREVACLVADDGSVIHWHEPPARTSVALPDSSTLWDIIWENRRRLLGIAHTHPGRGIPSPSHEDLTTFAAVDRALDSQLYWWIIDKTRCAVFRRNSRLVEDYNYVHSFPTFYSGPLAPRRDPDWVVEIRRRSGYGS